MSAFCWSRGQVWSGFGEETPCDSCVVCVSAALGGFSFLCAFPGLTVKWEKDGLQQEKTISVPEDIYNQGCVKDVDEGLEVNAEPVGIKAPEPSHCPGSNGN